MYVMCMNLREESQKHFMKFFSVDCGFIWLTVLVLFLAQGWYAGRIWWYDVCGTVCYTMVMKNSWNFLRNAEVCICVCAKGLLCKEKSQEVGVVGGKSMVLAKATFYFAWFVVKKKSQIWKARIYLRVFVH